MSLYLTLTNYWVVHHNIENIKSTKSFWGYYPRVVDMAPSKMSNWQDTIHSYDVFPKLDKCSTNKVDIILVKNYEKKLMTSVRNNVNYLIYCLAKYESSTESL